jgi:hypothetical protein
MVFENSVGYVNVQKECSQAVVFSVVQREQQLLQKSSWGIANRRCFVKLWACLRRDQKVIPVCGGRVFKFYP